MTVPDYRALSARATELLKGRTVDLVRLDGNEVLVRFTDGGSLFVNVDPASSPAVLEISIT